MSLYHRRPFLETMSAKLFVIGPLQSYVNGKKELEIESGQTVREMLMALDILPEVVALVIVNNEIQAKDYVIQDSDSVRIMAVIGGG